MLAIKGGCEGDAEVDLVQSVFLTNKRPFPSMANLLKHSRRIRSTFTEQQVDDVMSVLSHLGWSPQRMTSRARTWRRAALKIDKMIQALADEAEHGARKECALHNLQAIASYNRLMIAGMLADLTVEHQARIPPPTPLACCGNFVERQARISQPAPLACGGNGSRDCRPVSVRRWRDCGAGQRKQRKGS